MKVLLQTARIYAYSKNHVELVHVRIMLDSGSQRSHIINTLKKKLGLKPIKSESLNLNTFGNKSTKRLCDLLELCPQGRNGEDVRISALSFDSICSPSAAEVCLNQSTLAGIRASRLFSRL